MSKGCIHFFTIFYDYIKIPYTKMFYCYICRVISIWSDYGSCKNRYFYAGCVPKLSPIFYGNIWRFIMNNLREVKDDILKDWIEFREETLSTMGEQK